MFEYKKNVFQIILYRQYEYPLICHLTIMIMDTGKK